MCSSSAFNPSESRQIIPAAWLQINGRHLSFFVPLSEESYNLLVTSTIEMAVVYRSGPHNFARKPPPVLIPACVCALSSETSSRADCLGLCSSRRATSGTPCFAPWSSTWISTGRRRCCWEHTARSRRTFIKAVVTPWRRR